MKRSSGWNTSRPHTQQAPREPTAVPSWFHAFQPCDWSAIGILCVITLIFFGDLIFAPGEAVLSHKGTDLYHEFVYSRTFGFGELRQGNLPLWNPYRFAGMPFVGGFQSAPLYPLNWLYLVLLQVAINVGIALDVWLGGFLCTSGGSSAGLHALGAACLSAVQVLTGWMQGRRVAVFWQVHSHQFVLWDDPVNVSENPYLHPVTFDHILAFWQAPYSQLYIPLTYTVWSVMAAVSRWVSAHPLGQGPLDPQLFHSLNLVLHV